MAQHSQSAVNPEKPLWQWIGLAGLLALIAISAAIRVSVALHDPAIDPRNPRGTLRSDPAFLYYVTQSIVSAGGRAPADFRADPRLEYPDKTDIPAIETPGQEFFIAWLYLLLGKPAALHIFCIWTMSIFASLAVAGIYGLTWELLRSHRWALLSAALFTTFAANFRTLGFILIREDFALPWFALHLWLLARAVRVRSITSIALAAITFVLAAATWHAMTFVLAIELLAIFIWFVSSGQNIFADGRVWVAIAIAVAGSVLVPVLRSKLFVLSLPMQMIFAMRVAGSFRANLKTRRAQVLVAICAWGILLIVSIPVNRGRSDYSHVVSMMLAKVRHLGQRPADPNVLSPEARLLWSGPFVTSSFADLLIQCPMGLIGLMLALLALRAGNTDGRQVVLLLFATGSVVVALLVQRLWVLPGLTTPVAAAIAFSGFRDRKTGLAWMIAGTAVSGLYLGYMLSTYQSSWYMPAGRTTALAELLDAIDAQVPAGEPIVADFVTGAAILAHTGHPITQQPKYETARSRQRIIRFATVFCRGSPREFRDLVRSYGCRYVAIDIGQCWNGLSYTAGVPDWQTRPSPGTAAAFFCNPSVKVYGQIEGFRLLHAPQRGEKYAGYRLYEAE